MKFLHNWYIDDYTPPAKILEFEFDGIENGIIKLRIKIEKEFKK